MKKRGESKVTVIVLFLILIVFLHTFFHISVYGTGVNGFAKAGISGYALGPISIDEIKARSESFLPELSFYSKVILIAEWLLILIIILTKIIQKKLGSRGQKINFTVNEPKPSKSESRTDIDILYDLIKEYKKIKMSQVTRLFGVNEDTAKEWANILESHELASVNYPRIGEAELVYKKTAEEMKEDAKPDAKAKDSKQEKPAEKAKEKKK